MMDKVSVECKGMDSNELKIHHDGRELCMRSLDVQFRIDQSVVAIGEMCIGELRVDNAVGRFWTTIEGKKYFVVDPDKFDVVRKREAKELCDIP